MLILEKCNYCGELFIKKSNANKYCSENCSHEAQLESKRRHINKRNIKEKHYNTRVKNLTTLGSLGTSSTCHRKLDFEEEARSIQRMRKFLKV